MQRDTHEDHDVVIDRVVDYLAFTKEKFGRIVQSLNREMVLHTRACWLALNRNIIGVRR